MSRNKSMLEQLMQHLGAVEITEDGEVCPGCGKVHGEEVTLDQFREQQIKDYERTILVYQAGLDILKNHDVTEMGLKIAGLNGGHSPKSDDVLMVITYCNEEQSNFQIVAWNYTTGEKNAYFAHDAKTANAYEGYAREQLAKGATPNVKPDDVPLQ